MDRLASLRAQIDTIDDQILELIQKRAAIAAEVGKHKRGRADTPYYVPSREAEIIRRILAKNRAQQRHAHAARLPDAAVHAIFREIIGACLTLEHPLVVAYLGPEGTFSEEAVRKHFGATAEYRPCATLDDVFDEVESQRAAYGVVPVENALEGPIGRTLDLLAERRIQVCAEVLLGIHHQLLARTKELAEIRYVYSHPQALAQCRRWLDAHLKHAERREAPSTAEAARRAAEDPQAAAVGGMGLAERYGLYVLAANIEDRHDNTTRFFVIGTHDAAPSGDDRTSLVVSVQDRPGALFALLKPFAEAGVSLTRIESRPSRRALWEYRFFIDAVGHRDLPPLADVLETLATTPGVQLRVLGSYPRGETL
ncbi:MAG: prephenate dehydratase [Zetaproteobacteria bacterium]|nr:MAG: prephenate dehydratase [Zetaproteobacteria bacterium]